MVGLGFRAQGLRANIAESDLATSVFRLCDLGLKANATESDLSPWWVLALGLEVERQTLLSQICPLGGFFALRLQVHWQTLLSQIWSLGGCWFCGLGLMGKPC